MSQLKGKSSKSRYNEYFLSAKNPKKMLLLFKAAFESELHSAASHSCKTSLTYQFRETRIPANIPKRHSDESLRF